MTQGIYKIVNQQDGKDSTYIGGSIHIEQRWKEHCNRLRRGQHPNIHLQRAWDKYGEDAFVFSVLEKVERDMLLAVEQKYLDDHFGRGHCYNIAITAGPAGPMSEEARRKISEANRGKRPTEESKRKMSEAAMGKVFSEETRRKLSEAHRGHKVTEATRRKLSANAMGNQNWLGRQHTEESKRKMSKSNMGRKRGPMSKEHKRKLSEAHKGQVPWNKGDEDDNLASQ